MARNIEVKARVADLAALSEAAAAIATEGPFEIRQDDTFFRCETGRLKLRDFGDGTGEYDTPRDGELEARELMARFGIAREQLVAGAYVDLAQDDIQQIAATDR